MVQCFDKNLNRYVNCSPDFSTYVAIAIIIPIAILVVTIIVSAYLRYKRKLLLREQQQLNMTNVVAINNNDDEMGSASCNPSYPPNYSATYETSDDKPPSYEQTVQRTPTVNYPTANGVILSVNPTFTNQSVPLSRNPT